MNRQLFSMAIIYFSLLFSSASIFSSAALEEDFFLIDANTNQVLLESGMHTNDRASPCSTFKIALSVMGYDAGILTDENTPIWDFQEEYVDYIASWKAPQTPLTWMKNSCVWYSQVLVKELGAKQIQRYLQLLQYGNQDMSGGLTTAWIGSSLQISPKEQVHFIYKMLHGDLPISNKAVQLTKSLLFIEELPEGWKLFGKTGTGPLNKEERTEINWLVGWIEKEENTFIFSYAIRNQKIMPSERISRIKQILAESKIIEPPRK